MTRLLFFAHDHTALTALILTATCAAAVGLAAACAVGWTWMVEKHAENAAGDEL